MSVYKGTEEIKYNREILLHCAKLP